MVSKKMINLITWNKNIGTFTSIHVKLMNEIFRFTYEHNMDL